MCIFYRRIRTKQMRNATCSIREGKKSGSFFFKADQTKICIYITIRRKEYRAPCSYQQLCPRGMMKISLDFTYRIPAQNIICHEKDVAHFHEFLLSSYPGIKFVKLDCFDGYRREKTHYKNTLSHFASQIKTSGLIGLKSSLYNHTHFHQLINSQSENQNSIYKR